MALTKKLHSDGCLYEALYQLKQWITLQKWCNTSVALRTELGTLQT